MARSARAPGKRLPRVRDHGKLHIAIILCLPIKGLALTHRVVVLRHPSEAGFFRHIRECALGVLMTKTVPKPGIGLVRELAMRHRIVDPRSVGEEDIQPPVVVIVEEGYASSHGFQQVLVGSCGVFVLEIDPRGPGDIGELHLWTGCGSDHAEEKSK